MKCRWFLGQSSKGRLWPLDWDLSGSWGRRGLPMRTTLAWRRAWLLRDQPARAQGPSSQGIEVWSLEMNVGG